jgi:MoxR-like ATPase
MSTWWETRTDRVSQAVAAVSVQAECTVSGALALLRAHAEATGADLEEVAGAVLEHRIRFRPRGVALLSRSN